MGLVPVATEAALAGKTAEGYRIVSSIEPVLEYHADLDGRIR